MIPTALSNLICLGKNIPSFDQLTYAPSLGIHPGCKQRTVCFWVLGTQSTAGETKSALLASEGRGLPERPDSSQWPVSLVSCVTLPKLSWGCFYFHSRHFWGQKALRMCRSRVSQAPFHAPTHYLCGHTTWTTRDAGEALAHPVITVKD